jgi:TrmH family RNA methyltransferase
MMTPDQIEALYHECTQTTPSVGKQHPEIKRVMGILKHTESNPQRLAVVEGVRAHAKLLCAQLSVDTFIFCPKLIHSQQAKELVITYAARTSVACQVSEKVFLRIAERDAPDGLLSLIPLKIVTLDDLVLKEQNLLVILDGFEIPGNIGTIMRTIDGLQGDGLILCHPRARLTHPRVQQASQGACFFIPIVEIEDGTETLIQWLLQHNFTIYLADPKGEKTYYECSYSGRVALVAGSEHAGISNIWYECPHQGVRIPMFSATTDSFNVAIATTIILCEIGLRQRGYLTRSETL